MGACVCTGGDAFGGATASVLQVFSLLGEIAAMNPRVKRRRSFCGVALCSLPILFASFTSIRGDDHFDCAGFVRNLNYRRVTAAFCLSRKKYVPSYNNAQHQGFTNRQLLLILVLLDASEICLAPVRPPSTKNSASLLA